MPLFLSLRIDAISAVTHSRNLLGIHLGSLYAYQQMLEKRLAQLQRYADRLEALHLFLSEHPYLAAKSSIKTIPGGVALVLHEKPLCALRDETM